MRRLALVFVALGSCGCGMGFGSAYVGQWRARDVVEYRACLEDEQGKCISEKESIKHEPERSYFGVVVSTPAIGASFITHDGETKTRFRLDMSTEVLWGRGRAAYGVKGSFLVDAPATLMTPLMLMGHYSLHDRLGVYAGAGVIPWARTGAETANLGGRGLFGVQWALARVRSENFWILTVEADTSFIKFDTRYRSTGVVGNIGFYF